MLCHCTGYIIYIVLYEQKLWHFGFEMENSLSVCINALRSQSKYNLKFYAYLLLQFYRRQRLYGVTVLLSYSVWVAFDLGLYLYILYLIFTLQFLDCTVFECMDAIKQFCRSKKKCLFCSFPLSTFALIALAVIAFAFVSYLPTHFLSWQPFLFPALSTYSRPAPSTYWARHHSYQPPEITEC